MLRDFALSIAGLVWGVILLLVGARFLALLAGANPDSTLVDHVYRYSHFWVQPFFGVLGLENKSVANTGGTFEPASLLAFIAYFLAGALLLRLLSNVFFGEYRRA